LIVEGSLRPGDRLPPERELARHLGAGQQGKTRRGASGDAGAPDRV
jgi:DNA-binding transcriptional MocR family regulator